jgi:purine-cytosine permease-like protein
MTDWARRNARGLVALATVLYVAGFAIILVEAPRHPGLAELWIMQTAVSVAFAVALLATIAVMLAWASERSRRP